MGKLRSGGYGHSEINVRSKGDASICRSSVHQDWPKIYTIWKLKPSFITRQNGRFMKFYSLDTNQTGKYLVLWALAPKNVSCNLCFNEHRNIGPISNICQGNKSINDTKVLHQYKDNVLYIYDNPGTCYHLTEVGSHNRIIHYLGKVYYFKYQENRHKLKLTKIVFCRK